MAITLDELIAELVEVKRVNPAAGSARVDFCDEITTQSADYQRVRYDSGTVQVLIDFPLDEDPA